MKQEIIHQVTQGTVTVTVTRFGNPKYSPRLVVSFDMPGEMPPARILDYKLDQWLKSVGCDTCPHKTGHNGEHWAILSGVADLDLLKASDCSTLPSVFAK